MCDHFNRLKAEQIASANQTLANHGIDPKKLAWTPRQVLSENPNRISFVGGQVVTVTGHGTYTVEQKKLNGSDV